jgi:hypothetical protein
MTEKKKAEAERVEAPEETIVNCPDCGAVAGILAEESRRPQRLLAVETAQEDGGDGTSRAEG